MWRRLLLRRPPASPSPSAAACQIPVPCLYSRSSAVLKIGSTNKNALVRPFSLGLPTADKPAGQQLQARTLSAATSATPSIRGEPIGNAAGGLAADATPAQRQKYRQTLLHIFHHQLTARASKNSPMRFLRRVEESRDIFSADDFEVIMKGLNQLPNDWKLALRVRCCHCIALSVCVRCVCPCAAGGEPVALLSMIAAPVACSLFFSVTILLSPPMFCRWCCF